MKNIFKKKITHYSIISSIILCLVLCVGCEHESFDASLLSGYWQDGTIHEFYKADGTGYTWDTADDVTEDEAQPFTWTLNGATLVQNHQMTMGGVVPKTYTVTKLTTTTLSYHDSYDKSYTFTKY